MATEMLVGALSKLSAVTKLGKFGLTAFLVALATSLPELFVGISAAVAGSPEISLGNVLGSNIANLSLVIGGAALVAGGVGVVGEFLSRDFFTVFLVAALPMLMLLDGELGKIDGVALISVYVIYNVAILWKRPQYEKRRMGVLQRAMDRLKNWETDKAILGIVMGASLMIVAAEFLVRSAERIAVIANIPVFLVGLFLVAVGTSLPELSFEIGAIRKKEVGMVFGNLLGSVVANSTLVLGVTALLSPIKLVNGINSYLVATMAFVVVFGLFWFFAYSKKKLERWEGALLFGAYILFAVIEFLK